MTIDITHQLTGSEFMNPMNPLFGGGQIAKYPDVAFINGSTLVDIQRLRPQSFQLELPSIRKRSTHTHEAEHRAWLGRQLRVDIPPAETLLVETDGVSGDYQVFPHPIVLAFVDKLTEHGFIERYVEFMASQLYRGHEASPAASAYKQGLGCFLRDIEDFSKELKATREQYKSAPDAPFSPEMQVYLKDGDISSQYSAGIESLLEQISFTTQAHP